MNRIIQPYQPESFLDAGCFWDGLAAVQAKNRKWGYLDKTGHYAIPPQFDEVEDFYHKKKYAAVKQDGLWGYIGRDGSYLVPPTYLGRSRLTPSGSFGLVSTETPQQVPGAGRYVYFGPRQRLDYSGKPVGAPIDLGFDTSMEWRFTEERPMPVVTREGKWGFVNEDFEKESRRFHILLSASSLSFAFFLLGSSSKAFR